MSIDRRAAERRRFARLTGLVDGERTGLPVGDLQERDDARPHGADGTATDGDDRRSRGDDSTGDS